MIGKPANSGRRSRSRNVLFGIWPRRLYAGWSSVRLNVASISATCAALPSWVVTSEVTEEPGDARPDCMTRLMDIDYCYGPSKTNISVPMTIAQNGPDWAFRPTKFFTSKRARRPGTQIADRKLFRFGSHRGPAC